MRLALIAGLLLAACAPPHYNKKAVATPWNARAEGDQCVESAFERLLFQEIVNSAPLENVVTRTMVPPADWNGTINGVPGSELTTRCYARTDVRKYDVFEGKVTISCSVKRRGVTEYTLVAALEQTLQGDIVRCLREGGVYKWSVAAVAPNRSLL